MGLHWEAALHDLLFLQSLLSTSTPCLRPIFHSVLTQHL